MHGHLLMFIFETATVIFGNVHVCFKIFQIGFCTCLFILVNVYFETATVIFGNIQYAFLYKHSSKQPLLCYWEQE